MGTNGSFRYVSASLYFIQRKVRKLEDAFFNPILPFIDIPQQNYCK